MPSTSTKHRLILLGSGFAAMSVLRTIDPKLFDITVISPRNHFLFTPLLPSTTVGTVEFRSIIEPIRAAYPFAAFHQANCTSIDLTARSIACESAIDKEQFSLPFDSLVLAVGTINNTFGVAGVEQYALYLKEVADARAIRQRIIDCFERASEPGIPDSEKHRLLHFVVVGGGPTGVEFAAEMHDFVIRDLHKLYPALRSFIRITILEARAQILSTFDQVLGAYTVRHFHRQQIEVLTGSVVINIDADRITLKNGTEIPFGMVVWATGTGPTPLIKSLNAQKDYASRLIIDEFLRLKEHRNIYALGDCSVIESQNLPATAQVAEQQGKYLGAALTARTLGKPVQPFRYRHYGMLAYIGSERALADLSQVKGRGYSTYLFWRSAYLTRLVSFKNKILVLFDWMKTAV